MCYAGLRRTFRQAADCHENGWDDVPSRDYFCDVAVVEWHHLGLKEESISDFLSPIQQSSGANFRTGPGADQVTGSP
jgi:hypothetical protein